MDGAVSGRERLLSTWTARSARRTATPVDVVSAICGDMGRTERGGKLRHRRVHGACQRGRADDADVQYERDHHLHHQRTDERHDR